eukprot:698825-Prymnesium_polylepis.2
MELEDGLQQDNSDVEETRLIKGADDDEPRFIDGAASPQLGLIDPDRDVREILLLAREAR